MPKYEVELEGNVIVTAASEVDAEDIAMNLIHGDLSTWSETNAEMEFNVVGVEEVDGD